MNGVYLMYSWRIGFVPWIIWVISNLSSSRPQEVTSYVVYVARAAPVTCLLHMVIFHVYINLPVARGFNPYTGVGSRRFFSMAQMFSQWPINRTIVMLNYTMTYATIPLCMYIILIIIYIYMKHIYFSCSCSMLFYFPYTSFFILFTGLIPVWSSGICINKFMFYLDPPKVFYPINLVLSFFLMVSGGSRYVPQWK